MSNELLALWEQSHPSVVFVTLDLEEAIALAARVVVLTAGPGTVKDVYEIDLPRPLEVPEIRFDRRFVELLGSPGRIRFAGRGLGQDNEHVYAERLGLDRERIKQLREHGVIRCTAATSSPPGHTVKPLIIRSPTPRTGRRRPSAPAA